MAKRKEAREQTSPTKAEAGDPKPDTPEAAAPPHEEAAAPQAAEAAKLPPAPQLSEPVVPPFLREHENRVVAARTPASPKPAAIAARTKDKPRSRFPLLAATLAIAAGLGGAAGAVGIPALIQVSFGQAKAAPVVDEAADGHALKALVAQLTTDVSALRTTIEQAAKLTASQFGKVNERLERAERAIAEPAAKIAKIGEAVERLERRAAPVVAAPPQADVTSAMNTAQPPAPEPKPKPPIIDDYVVRKVFDGVALVEGRRGIIEVEPGSTLAGAGRVEEIRRQDGRWVVVTSKGLILPPR